MAVEHEVGAGVVEVLPQRPRGRRLPALPPEVKSGWCQKASVQAPGARRGPRAATAPAASRRAQPPPDGSALRVERDDVPGADVEAVVALAAAARRSRSRVPDAVEVVEVARRPGRAVLVVAHGGVGEVLQPPPARVVGPQEVAVGRPWYWASPSVEHAATGRARAAGRRSGCCGSCGSVPEAVAERRVGRDRRRCRRPRRPPGRRRWAASRRRAGRSIAAVCGETAPPFVRIAERRDGAAAPDGEHDPAPVGRPRRRADPALQSREPALGAGVRAMT